MLSQCHGSAQPSRPFLGSVGDLHSLRFSNVVPTLCGFGTYHSSRSFRQGPLSGLSSIAIGTIQSFAFQNDQDSGQRLGELFGRRASRYIGFPCLSDHLLNREWKVTLFHTRSFGSNVFPQLIDSIDFASSSGSLVGQQFVKDHGPTVTIHLGIVSGSTNGIHFGRSITISCCGTGGCP